MDEFEKLLITNKPEAQELARELRRLIQRLLPKAQEKIYRGWGVADYTFGGSGRGFLTIGPQKGYVNLYFMDGVDLDDPDGLLEGSGKRLRHVKIRTPEDLKKRSLHALVRQAAKSERSGDPASRSSPNRKRRELGGAGRNRATR